MSEERIQGTVKWFDNAKGFGFITPDDGSKDLFVHYSEIQVEGYASLEEGERVEMTREEADKGPQAVRVTKIGGPPAPPSPSPYT
jgi:CspA family cold shock protein